MTIILSKKCDEYVSTNKIGRSQSFHDYAENASFHIPNDVFEKKHKAGWVNFGSYLYAWGRDIESAEEYFKGGQNGLG